MLTVPYSKGCGKKPNNHSILSFSKLLTGIKTEICIGLWEIRRVYKPCKDAILSVG